MLYCYGNTAGAAFRMRSIIFLVAALAASLAACGATPGGDEGRLTDRSYQVGAFERISVAGPYEVEVRTGSAPTVRAGGSEKAIEQLEVEVEGDTLVIRQKKRSGLHLGWSKKSSTARLTVTVPRLREARIAGSGLIAVDQITGDQFRGGVAGSGEIRLGNVEVERLDLGIAGSGDIRVERGSAREVRYEIAGSGDLDAASLAAQRATVSIAGSGDVRGQATETASVDIAGSGDVRLTGGARCTVRKAGSGDVVCS